MTEQATAQVETAHVRRVPKYSVFLLLGAAVGIIAALALTFGFTGSAETSSNTGLEYSAGQVFGFVALAAIPIGMALGGIVALLLDRAGRRHSREVRITHDRVRVVDEPTATATDAGPVSTTPPPAPSEGHSGR